MDDLAKLCQYNRGMFIVLYADDIILLSGYLLKLQNMLDVYFECGNCLDIVFNAKKSTLFHLQLVLTLVGYVMDCR